MPDNEEILPALRTDVAPGSAPSSRWRRVFLGPDGLRAGWRLILWLLLLFAIMTAVRLLRQQFFPAPPRVDGAPVEPVRGAISFLLAFLSTVLATLVMARLERRRWGDYGLPLRRVLSLDFGFGLVWGCATVALVVGAMWLAGAYRVESLALHGLEAGKFAALWALAMLFVALLEEFLLRGYLLYTLASGMGFWPAAALTSALFFAGHIANPGETWLGLAYIFLDGFLLCFTVWLTGDLWFAVGAHAGWNWALTYLFSVPNSGTTAVGHLLNVRLQGPQWLSGGAAGPEGSVLSIVLDAASFFVLFAIYKRRRWSFPAPVR